MFRLPDPMQIVREGAGMARAAGEGLVKLSEGDIAGAVKKAGEYYEHLGNGIEEALDDSPLGGLGDLYQAGGKLLQGDVEGAFREGVQGAVEGAIGLSPVALGLAQLVGKDAVRNVVQTTLDGLVKNPAGVKRSMEFLGRQNEPTTNVIASPHTPERPNKCIEHNKAASEKLASDIDAARNEGNLGQHACCKLPHMIAYLGLFPANGGYQPSAGRTPKNPSECIKIGNEISQKIEQWGNAPKTTRESALKALPKPAAFEDIVAAFMVDQLAHQQDEVRQKIEELNAINEQIKTGGPNSPNKAGEVGEVGGGEKKSGFDLASALNIAANVVDVAGTVAGVVAALAPVLGLAVNVLPVAGQGIYAGILAAAPALGIAASVAPFLSQGLRELSGSEMVQNFGKDEAQVNANSGAADVAGSSGETKSVDKEELKDSRALLMEQMKNSMNKLQQMQTALSDVLKAMHDTAMSSIRNIK